MRKRTPAPAPLAEAIRGLREELGLTQREFAARLEVPQSTVYRWETGGASPRGESLARLNRLAAAGGLRLELAGPGQAPAREGAKARIVAATLRLLEAELAFCRDLEAAKADPELGSSAWEMLGEILAAHRRRIADFLLEAQRTPPERFNFWKAVGLLKVYSWKAQAPGLDPMAQGYVAPGQLAPVPPRARG